MEDAIAGEAGISGGLALDIPFLLIVNGYILFDKLNQVQQGISDRNHIICFSGVKSEAIERIIKLRVADNMIVGQHDKYAIPGGIVESESEYTNIEMT
jgi:hypothetical protein